MQHWSALIGTMRNILPSHSSAVWEDLAGDTVEKALRNADHYQEYGSGPYCWLMLMGRRVALDYVRRKANGQTLPLVEWSAVATDAGNERHADSIDVRAAVDALPERHRTLIEQRYWDGLYLKEIGHRTTVYRREVVATTLLRAALQEAV